MLRTYVALLTSLLLFAAGPLRAQEHQTPWHVPIPAAGPKVGILAWGDAASLNERFPQTMDWKGRFLLVMFMFSYVGLFAQADYQPTLLLPPDLAADARIRRALAMCEYPSSLILPVTEQTEFRQFAALVVPQIPRFHCAPGLAPILQNYLRAGGKVIYLPWCTRAEDDDTGYLEFLGLTGDQLTDVPYTIDRVTDHPLLAGIRFPLTGNWPRLDGRVYAYRDPAKPVTPLLRFTPDGPVALSIWQEGSGQVAYLNADMFNGNKTALNSDGLVLNDLVLRAADSMTGAHPGEPRPTIKERIERLKERDALKPATPEDLLFTTSFDKPEDLSAWSIWDVPTANSGPKKGWWWVDTNAGSLNQISGVYSYSGVGTRATVGSLEWNDYVISTTVTPFGDDEWSIIFRAMDADNYYRLSFDADTHVRTCLEKRVNGKLSTLASVARPHIPRVPVRYQIAVRGDTIVAYADGKEFMRATDIIFRMGGAGIETNGADIGVYDFEVFRLPPPAAAP